MTLGELVEGLGCVLKGDENTVVTGITYDSREVRQEGMLFAAIKGEHSDGYDHIAGAVRLGARSVLTERESLEEVAQVVTDDLRGVLARLSERFYGSPASELTLIGITGTNGKTTTAYLIESILKEAGIGSGLMGTINYRYGAVALPAERTTPEAPDLSRLLSEMVAAGITHTILEVSSHALKQKRVDGLSFSVALFTNLTHEHLDYHVTMEDYFSSKARLFFELIEEGGVAVVNLDDPYGERLARELDGPITYSLDKGAGATFFPKSFELTSDGIDAVIATPEGVVEVRSSLVGEYNLSNILASLATASALGIDLDTAATAVAGLSSVAGRVQRVEVEGVVFPFDAYVDYAHTPDALARVMAALKAVTKGRLITVFGCGGDRDRTKRSEMGSAAIKISEVVIITSDNPRSEEPLKIIADIELGMTDAEKVEKDAEDSSVGYMVITDRREAIKKAVAIAREADTVLIAGKGHEVCQIVGSEKHRFDDMEELIAAINERYGSLRA